MAINCIIIDDEQHNLENLRLLLTRHCLNVNVVGLANSANEGVLMITQHQPDLVFLDIEMSGKNGFDMLESIREINFEVIFVTAYNQYAIQAIKTCALDYLMKPIVISELVNAVSKVSMVVHKKKQNERLKILVQNLKRPKRPFKIALPTAEELYFITPDEVVRCQGENNYTHFYLVDGRRILVSRTLKEWDELLSEYQFIRTHQSHLVNSKHVQSYVKKDGGYILMIDGSVASVSKLRKEYVLSQLVSSK